MGALLCEHVQTHAMCAHVYIRPTALQCTASLKRSVIALAQVEVLLYTSTRGIWTASASRRLQFKRSTYSNVHSLRAFAWSLLIFMIGVML